ncbi:MAG: AraC family transcriptional regulator [Bacteroidota bacterium]
MDNLIVHRSISDLYKALNLPVEQEMDFTIHSLPEIHDHVPFESPTFRADYYSFVFIKDGRGTYTIDQKTYPTSSGTIYFTNPGHIKAFRIEEIQDAYIITLTEAFLKEYVHQDIFDEFPFLLAETVPPKTLSAEEFQDYEHLYLQIFKEFNARSSYKYKILGNLFVVMLLKIKERFWSGYDPISEGDRSSQIVKHFKQKLASHFRALHNGEIDFLPQVQDLAHQMNLHPNYFSNVIKSKTGRSVNLWIVEKAITSAKALLKNTPLSIKQIGIQLGFSEPTHFSSYFKKHAGFTPNQYRKEVTQG